MLAKREHWRVKRRVPALVQGRVGMDAFVRPAERSEAHIRYALTIRPVINPWLLSIPGSA